MYPDVSNICDRHDILKSSLPQTFSVKQRRIVFGRMFLLII